MVSHVKWTVDTKTVLLMPDGRFIHKSLPKNHTCPETEEPAESYKDWGVGWGVANNERESVLCLILINTGGLHLFMAEVKYVLYNYLINEVQVYKVCKGPVSVLAVDRGINVCFLGCLCILLMWCQGGLQGVSCLFGWIALRKISLPAIMNPNLF